jgi:hypothetical protein
MSGIAVVHLARKRNGIAPFEKFLESYREHAAGMAHELVILYKGFHGDGDTRDHEARLAGLPHRLELIADRGFDVHAYFDAVERLEYDSYCFLNSYSRILADGWLEKLHRAVARDGVGLVSATGSAQSFGSEIAAYREQVQALPPGKRLVTRVVGRLRDLNPGTQIHRVWLWILRTAGVWDPVRDFPPFPNYHVRTNAFMGARATLRRVRLPPMPVKMSAYKFESGVDSLTRQVLDLGMRVLVVGRDGEAFPPERWHASNTFWQARQENLLVADNQTDLYMTANPAQCAEFARHAWGGLARPG